MKITSSAMGGETGLRTLAKAGLNSLKNYFKDSYNVGNGYAQISGFILGGLPTAAAVTGLGINYALQTYTSPMDFWVKTLAGIGVASLAGAASSKIVTEGINLLRLKPLMDEPLRRLKIEYPERDRELLGEMTFLKVFSKAMEGLFSRASKEELVKTQALDNLGKFSTERTSVDSHNKVSHEEAVKKVEEKAKKEPMSFSL